VFLGLAFLVLLFFSYFENVFFFQILATLFENQILAFLMIFIHNVIAISLILLAMTFYVNLVVQGVFKDQKYEYVILEHPRTFAAFFTIIVVFLSILRAATLVFGEIRVEELPNILLMSAPIAIIEGFPIYLTIKKTLNRTISLKDLAYIYGIFFVAAVIELSFIRLFK